MRRKISSVKIRKKQEQKCRRASSNKYNNSGVLLHRQKSSVSEMGKLTHLKFQLLEALATQGDMMSTYLFSFPVNSASASASASQH